MAVDARAAWTRARTRTLPALALAPALAGCASSSPAGNGVASNSPSRIVARATAAATAAESVHVAGSILSEGKPISLNMELDAEKGGKGRLTLGNLSVDVVNVDRAIYLKAGPAFYSRFAGPAAARVLQAKWLRGSSVKRAARVVHIADRSAQAAAQHARRATALSRAVRRRRSMASRPSA